MSMWTRWLRRIGLAPQKTRRLTGKTDAKKRPLRRLGVEHLEARMLLSASVWTDKLDYAPGSTAILTGSGFQFGETVNLQVLHTDGTPSPGDAPWTVTDGG